MKSKFYPEVVTCHGCLWKPEDKALYRTFDLKEEITAEAARQHDRESAECKEDGGRNLWILIGHVQTEK